MGARFAAVGRCGVFLARVGRSYNLTVFTRIERQLAFYAGFDGGVGVDFSEYGAVLVYPGGDGGHGLAQGLGFWYVQGVVLNVQRTLNTGKHCDHWLVQSVQGVPCVYTRERIK
jgi:hypothetical protein